LAVPSRLGAIITVGLLSCIVLGAVWAFVIYLLPQSDAESNQSDLLGKAPPKPLLQAEPLGQAEMPDRHQSEPSVPPVAMRELARPAEGKPSDRGSLETGRPRPGLDLKCDAEIDLHCPEGEAEDRRACVQDKLRQFSMPCQQVLRERIVRVKESLLHLRAACESDAKRFCRHVAPGGGALMQCLEDHAQEVSDLCFQLLPKRGRLLN
jgi:hypothetical protein